MMHKDLHKLADRSWKLGSIDSLLKRIRKTGCLVTTHAAEDRVRRVAVEDLVFSHAQAKKTPIRP